MREPELFIGGPCGGQKRSLPNDSNFTRITLEDNGAPASVLAPDGKPFATGRLKYADYRRHRWNTPQGEIAFWSPVEMTPMDCIKLLMSSYEVVKSVTQ